MWIATNDAIHLLKRSIYHLKPRLNEIEQQLRSIRKSPYKIVKLVKQASSSSDWVGVSSRSIMSALLQSLIDSHFRLDWVSRFGSSHLNHCCFFSWRIFSSFCSLSVIESLVLFFSISFTNTLTFRGFLLISLIASAFFNQNRTHNPL